MNRPSIPALTAPDSSDHPAGLASATSITACTSSLGMKPRRILLGDTIKVPAYQLNGVTVRANVHSAAWRRRWWLHDFGSDSAVRLSLIKSAGSDPELEPYWLPRISFPSLRAACAAIVKATGVAS